MSHDWRPPCRNDCKQKSRSFTEVRPSTDGFPTQDWPQDRDWAVRL